MFFGFENRYWKSNSNLKSNETNSWNTVIIFDKLQNIFHELKDKVQNDIEENKKSPTKERDGSNWYDESK